MGILLSSLLSVVIVVAAFILWQLILYKKVKINVKPSIWFRYYNRFTRKLSYEYWNEWEDYSGIEIKIWHKKNGFEWKKSWLKRNPEAYDWWSPYYEHFNTGFKECDDSNRDRIVKAFLFENGVDHDP
jgi:hypothetical protein